MLLLEARVRLRSQSRADARRAVAPLREATAIPGAPAEVWFFLGESLAGYNSPAAREAYGRYLELAPQGMHAALARRATGN